MIWETARPAKLGLVRSEPLRERRIQAIDHEVAKHLGRLRLGHAGPKQGKDRVSGALVVPRVDGQLGQEPADVALPVGEQPRHLDLGIERPLDRLGQQVHLVAEEVDEQRGIDPGLRGDCPHRRSLIAALGEQLPGRPEDVLTGGAVAGTTAGAAVLALAIGLLTGAAAAGADVSFGDMIGAGANCLPIALLFLSLGTLAFAIVPRVTTGISYGLVLVAFVWGLFGSLVDLPGWTVELSPFHQVALVPAESFQGGCSRRDGRDRVTCD